MINLGNDKRGIIIITSDNTSISDFDRKFHGERIYSVLSSKEFEIIPIKCYKDNSIYESFLCLSEIYDSNEFRKEILHILEFLDLDSSFVKYPSSDDFVLISRTGTEEKHVLKMYEESKNDLKFIYESIFFSFEKKQSYFYPKKSNHLKNGLIVEYFNNEKWNSKEIKNVDEEFDKMYKLLMKYDKLRIPLN